MKCEKLIWLDAQISAELVQLMMQPLALALRVAALSEQPQLTAAVVSVARARAERSAEWLEA